MILPSSFVSQSSECNSYIYQIASCNVDGLIDAYHMGNALPLAVLTPGMHKGNALPLSVLTPGINITQDVLIVAHKFLKLFTNPNV